MSQPQLLTLGILILAVVFGLLRCTLRQRRAPMPKLRFTFLLITQPTLAALLYLGLYPPPTAVTADTLTVFTAEAPVSTPAKGLRIALPEAPPAVQAQRFPDLASALRRFPNISRLHIVGQGLELRDLEAAKHRPLTFSPSAKPTGLIQLSAPRQVAVGNSFQVSGRVQGIAQGRVELLTPAQQRAAETRLTSHGAFSLSGSVKTAGLAAFQLRIFDAHNKLRETFPITLEVQAPPPLRILVLAGAPTPELKYLRRWALDAGATLHTRISAGDGLILGDAPLTLNTETLNKFDAALLDQRSLGALSSNELRNLKQSIEAGLGLLIRTESTLTAGERTRLRALGLAQPSGTWQAVGRGRITTMQASDTFKQVLAGESSQHAQFWSHAFAAIARPSTQPEAPSIPAFIWPNVAAQLCGLATNAAVIAPNNTQVPLAIDPATGSRRCAAFWPTQPSWHQIKSGRTSTGFAVLNSEIGVALRAQQRLDATQALATASFPVQAKRLTQQNGSPWPWLALWLTLASAVWWLERRS